MATSIWGLPQPAGTDLASTADNSIKAISDALDNATQAVTMMRKGVFASRPTASTAKSGCYYLATDTSVLYLSDGTNWIAVNAADQVAGTASQRTLGTGATQAAAGNHVHAGYSIVPGSSANERILYGLVDTDGSRRHGSPGWTCVRNSVANWTLTYGVTLSNVAVVLTPWTGGGNHAGGTYGMTHNTPQGTSVDVYMRDTASGALDEWSWSFIIVGTV